MTDIEDTEVFATQHEVLCTEARDLFARAFNGEDVKLPRPKSLADGVILYDVSLLDIIGEMEADADNPITLQARKAQLDGLKFGADHAHCAGTYREAVIAFYLEWYGDDLTRIMVHERIREAGEARAEALEEAGL